MTRRQFAGAAGATGLAAAGYTWAAAGDHPAADPTDLPNLWQWDLLRVPPPGRRPMDLLTLLRSHPVRADRPPPIRREPLRAGEGDDRVLGSDTLSDDLAPDGARLTLQVLDLRQLGVATGPADGPLRLNGVLRVYGSGQRFVARLLGHSLRGGATVHRPPAWVGGELPLVTLTTAGREGLTEYTVLLAVRGRV